jgi:hypothetical protein
LFISTVRFGSKNRRKMSKKCDQGDAGALRAGFSLILGLVCFDVRFCPEICIQPLSGKVSEGKEIPFVVVDLPGKFYSADEPCSR